MSARPLSQLLTMAREALDELRALRQAVQDTDRDRRRRGYGLGDVVTMSEAARVLGMDYASTRRLVLDWTDGVAFRWPLVARCGEWTFFIHQAAAHEPPGGGRWLGQALKYSSLHDERG